ncbi:MAG: hypothetical protein DDT26_00748 [Dehalococcoidia bacterium]|nr:hypothetical protein [Chloroflexota bacterium]
MDSAKQAKYRASPLVPSDDDFKRSLARKFNDWEVVEVDGLDFHNSLSSTLSVLRQLGVTGPTLVAGAGVVFNKMSPPSLADNVAVAASLNFKYLDDPRLNMYSMVSVPTNRSYDAHLFYLNLDLIPADREYESDAALIRGTKFSRLPDSYYARQDDLVSLALGARDVVTHGATMQDAVAFNCWSRALSRRQDIESYAAYPYDSMLRAMKGVKRFIPPSTVEVLTANAAESKKWSNMKAWVITKYNAA